MKLIIFVLSFLLFFTLLDVSAQNTSTIKTPLTTISPSKATFQFPILPISHLKTKAPQGLPLLRIPQSYYNQYVIRVLQLDHRSLRQNLFINTYLFSAKSNDHDGYDYFLPLAFKKKEWGEDYIDKLPSYLKDKAILMKLDPNKPSCNCFSKF